VSHETLADLIESFKAEGRQLGATLLHVAFLKNGKERTRASTFCAAMSGARICSRITQARQSCDRC